MSGGRLILGWMFLGYRWDLQHLFDMTDCHHGRDNKTLQRQYSWPGCLALDWSLRIGTLASPDWIAQVMCFTPRVWDQHLFSWRWSINDSGECHYQNYRNQGGSVGAGRQNNNSNNNNNCIFLWFAKQTIQVYSVVKFFLIGGYLLYSAVLASATYTTAWISHKYMGVFSCLTWKKCKGSRIKKWLRTWILGPDCMGSIISHIRFWQILNLSLP